VGGVGTTTGNYTIQAVLNLSLEAESNGGSSNDSLATAQDLTPNLVSFGSGLLRANIRGRTEAPSASIVNETEANGTIATANNAATYYAVPNNNVYQIGISGTLSTTADGDYFNIGTLQAGD